MDNVRTGELIRRLRTEKGLTQREIAERMNISDKTVSKWERGCGGPDISLLSDLASVLEVGAEALLSGSLETNTHTGGNMKRTQFYFCPECRSIITSTGKAEAVCCGRKLSPLEAKEATEEHLPIIEDTDGEYYITIPHEMTKSHYIVFAAFVSDSCCFTARLYPEQDPSFRFPRMRSGKFYIFCVKDGLFYIKL